MYLDSKMWRPQKKNSISTVKRSFLHNWWWVVSIICQILRDWLYPFILTYIKSPIKNMVKRNNIALINLAKSLRKIKFLVLQIKYFRFYIPIPQFSWNVICEEVLKNLVYYSYSWHIIKTEISHGYVSRKLLVEVRFRNNINIIINFKCSLDIHWPYSV